MTTHRRFLTKRYLLWGGGALVVLALLGAALKPKPEPADFSTATRGPLRITVDEEGETRVRERFVISAPLPGKLLRIELDPGDSVIAGETVLATFQPADPSLLDARSRAERSARVRAAQSALGRARAEREQAKALLELALSEHQRLTRLAGDEIVSAQLLEQAATEVESRREGLRAAEYAAGSAEYELAAARAGLLEEGGAAGDPIAIRSPIDGQVLRNLRESEAIVPAGEPLLEVGDPQALEIVSDLLSTDAVRVRPGQRVIIEQWGGEEPLAGVVRRVEPFGFTKISALGVEEQRVNVVIDFSGPPAERAALGDGYRVEVAIVVWESDDVLRIPTSSLFRDGEGWAVWAVDGGRASLRPVEIGVRNGLSAQVVSGISEGERLIVHPSDGIEDGIAVEQRG